MLWTHENSDGGELAHGEVVIRRNLAKSLSAGISLWNLGHLAISGKCRAKNQTKSTEEVMLADTIVHRVAFAAMPTFCAFMFVSLLSASPANADEVSVPPPGTSMRYDCDGTPGKNDYYEYTVAEVKDGKVKFELNWKRGGSGYGVKDVWAWVTSIYDERKQGNRKTKMTRTSGSLAEIATLEVGEKVSAWYRQWDSEHGRSRWKYKVHIKEKKEVETKNFGMQTVYVVVEKRQSEWDYVSEMVVHYAPALSNVTYWTYTDNKKNSEECHLTEMK